MFSALYPTWLVYHFLCISTGRWNWMLWCDMEFLCFDYSCSHLNYSRLNIIPIWSRLRHFENDHKAKIVLRKNVWFTVYRVKKVMIITVQHAFFIFNYHSFWKESFVYLCCFASIIFVQVINYIEILLW